MTAPAPTTTPQVRETFLDALKAADLFTPTQLARAEAAISPHISTAAEAAHLLVAGGFLTRFQSERLLAGRTDGFHLGPYLILEQVGRGAMGRVYKAKHRTMNRPVAIKVLSAELTRTTSARQAFQRAVRSAAQLNHPNIVIAYDANEVNERFYLVLEFVDGPNLETLVRERGPLPAADACELIRQAAIGLAHAHRHGMFHKNIKPVNILVTRPSRSDRGSLVKIADFGIAKLAPDQPLTLGLLAGPDYVAPEQAHNPRSADHRSDLYSLGAVLYFLLTGRPPFWGGSAESKVHRHTWEEPAPVNHLRADIHPAVVALVHQLLAKHPQSRPSSAGEVAERLSSGYAASDAVNFDLPSPHIGPYSFIMGQHSGQHPASAMENVGRGSGQLTNPNHEGNTDTLSRDQTSEWEQITAAQQQSNSPKSVRSARGKRGSRGSIWDRLGLLAVLLLVCLIGTGVVLKVIAK